MEHEFIFPKPLREIPVGEGYAIVVYEDPISPANIGFKHVCGSWEDLDQPDGVFTKVVAPRLSKHTVTGPEDALTIRASILCLDCHLHGFVTNGVWESV